jgi:intracellular septation protein
MPAEVWRKLNWAWISFFMFAGASNAYVAFHFQQYWVDFKVFGSLAMTIVFIIGQFVLLSRYLKQDINNPERNNMWYAIIAEDTANSLSQTS